MANVTQSWENEGGVWSISVSADGGRVAASVGLSIMAWDIHNGRRVLGPLESHKFDGAVCIAFSPDGRTLVSGCQSGSVHTWNTAAGGIGLQLCGKHTRTVYSVAFSHDGRRLISGSADGTICRWDTRTWSPLGKSIAPGSNVGPVAISADDRLVFAGLGDATVKAYDLNSGEMVFQCVGHMLWIHSLAVSPDGRRLASGSGDSTIRIWDAASGKSILDPLEGHTHGVISLAFSPDSSHLVSGSTDMTIRIWDVRDGVACVGLLRDHTAQVSALAFTPDGTRLISGSADQTIKVWDVQSLGIQTSRTATKTAVPYAEPSKSEVTHMMNPDQIVSLLGARGCANMTGQLNLRSLSDHPISSGGFGETYRCRLNNSTEVAIKTVRLSFGLEEKTQNQLKQIARELYAWTQCRHPNVQGLLGVVVFRQQLGIVAQWQSKGSMPEYLQGNPRVDRCNMGAQIAKGLAYIHECNLVHGDLKGANVLVSHDGRPLLANFGSATLQDPTLKFSNTSTTVGLSLRWAAPELLQGNNTFTTASDVYALGMTVLEAITGNVPWFGRADFAVVYAVATKLCPDRPEDRISSNSEHGEALWWLLRSCWEFEPEKRLSSLEVLSVLKYMTDEGLRRK